MYKTHSCCGSPAKELEVQVTPAPAKHLTLSANKCNGQKPTASAFDNFDCIKQNVIVASEQAGADVTAGYKGGLDVASRTPLTESYFSKGLCPVNVHWHLGAEHRSQGQYDENGKGPGLAGTPDKDHDPGRRMAGTYRYGFACHHYDANDKKFTTPYKWQHCVNMHVGETYEIHWPHSALGACHTPHQFQSPFYDGVFCNWVYDGPNPTSPTAQQLAHAVGVQAQIFTIVNDENYYYPDLMRGAIVDGDFWKDVAAYTGSTTGTSRNNIKCSAYAPITWQVDRKCHKISASNFDKMCADMKQNPDDMSSDLYAHGARELVWSKYTANNQAEFAR